MGYFPQVTQLEAAFDLVYRGQELQVEDIPYAALAAMKLISAGKKLQLMDARTHPIAHCSRKQDSARGWSCSLATTRPAYTA
jgi:hypothetical protein